MKAQRDIDNSTYALNITFDMFKGIKRIRIVLNYSRFLKPLHNGL